MTRLASVAFPLLLLVAIAAPAQEPPAPADGPAKIVVPPSGTEAFRSFLGKRKVEPLRNLKALGNNPSRTLLVVLGGSGDLTLRGEYMRSRSLERFVQAGGAVLFATDRDSDPVWWNAFSVRVVSGVFVATEPADHYRPDSDDLLLQGCPLVVPMRDADPDLFANVPEPVATNRPARLDGYSLNRIAHYGRSFGRLVGDEVELVEQNGGDFARGGRLGDGKVLLLADHSVFTNALMVPTDNGNFDFAFNVTEWLLTDSLGRQKRDQCLFIEEGKVVTNFESLDRLDIELPTPEQMLALGNEALQGAQRDDLLNKLAAEANKAFFSILPLERLLALLAVAIALALAFGGAVRFLSSRSPTVVTAPLNANAWYRTVPVIDQRQHALVQSGNLYLLTQERIRTGLLELGAPAKIESPTVVVRGGWFARRSWSRLATNLCRLAWSEKPRMVSMRAARDIHRDLQRLRQAVGAGIVRFEQPGNP